MPVQPGYQEAHEIYNEMRQFFAQKAMSVHNGEVVVIKVTMMSLKPGNKNPSVVSVRETNVLSLRPLF
jgi:murein L,D-transpeptidase YcbB/YkuD